MAVMCDGHVSTYKSVHVNMLSCDALHEHVMGHVI
jgi:hypothetical protein